MEFIKARRAAIRERGTPLWERKTELLKELNGIEPQITALTDEWKELEKMASAVGVDLNNMPPEPTDSESTTTPALTIKEAILRVLTNSPEGLPSPEILDQINIEYFNHNIARTSFSPQLSRLKQDEEVVVMNGKYFLNQKRPVVEPPFERRF